MEANTPRFYFVFLSLLLSSRFLVEGFSGEEEEEEKDIKITDFPHGFVFGVSTSAYQIEGAYLEGGKSLNNWDVFSRIQGNIKHGDNGYISVDDYHRYLEDTEIVHSLGVKAYRLSISWSRVLPEGRFGQVNPAGVMFYSNVIDKLLLKGIEPFLTIHHHDLPQELEDRYGAWLSPLMQEDFVHFAEICFKNFGDRVKYWMTINEPNLFANLAYMDGKYPPGRCSLPFGNCSVGNSDIEPLTVMHNMLLAHAKAAKLYRDHFQAIRLPKQGGSIGIVVSATMFEPLRDDPIDQEAANRASLDPLLFGDYPPEMRHYLGSNLPCFSPEETKYIEGSIDFIAVNHYTTLYAKDCLHSNCTAGADHAIKGYAYITGERDGVFIGEPTGMPECYVVPRGMENIVDYLKKRYHNMPMFVTENGYASLELQDAQMKNLLHDSKRIEFHKAYLAFLARAIRKGADVRGYFVWTLMDDFEWISGYRMRLGMYYVHPQTLNRIPKLSAQWYEGFLSSNGLNNKEATNASLLKDENAIVSEPVNETAEI
ncbi:hypothetical protein RJ639_047844 [Escallonia herrerae]|uniref:Beta-glucosidase 18-like n=1 Tax=Escallonia herrerae TaxID=1293975 RepID=A0AA89AZF4_9ASTE|nr:hypothetical protein RJ639_047844 [Escallonia herrerae]